MNQNVVSFSNIQCVGAVASKPPRRNCVHCGFAIRPNGCGAYPRRANKKVRENGRETSKLVLVVDWFDAGSDIEQDMVHADCIEKYVLWKFPELMSDRRP